MSIKFSIRTAAIAILLAVSYSSISTAEVYKTIKGQVIVTELTAKQKYSVQIVNAKNKTKKLKDKIANTCGEVTIDNAGTYKSLVVGTETINPATLNIKVHPRCNAKKTTAAANKKTTIKSTTSTIISPANTPTTVPAVTPMVK
jgi:predicted peptidase